MLDAYGDYLSAIGRVPLLTSAEEVHLGTLVQQWRDHSQPDLPMERRGRRAMERMVTANLRLVVSVCKHYRHRIQQLDLEPIDVVQAGNLGLIRAVEGFVPSRGYRFSTYGYWWIRQAIHRHLQEHHGPIRVPAQVSQLARKAKAIQAAHPTTLPLAVLANLMGETEKRLSFVIRAVHEAHPLSLDQPVGSADGECCLVDLLSQGDGLRDPEGYEWLHQELAQLPAQELSVIRLRYYGHPDLSMAKVAELMGTTKDKVQRLERKALKRLHQRVSPMLSPMAKAPTRGITRCSARGSNNGGAVQLSGYSRSASSSASTS